MSIPSWFSSEDYSDIVTYHDVDGASVNLQQSSVPRKLNQPTFFQKYWTPLLGASIIGGGIATRSILSGSKEDGVDVSKVRQKISCKRQSTKTATTSNAALIVILIIMIVAAVAFVIFYFWQSGD